MFRLFVPAAVCIFLPFTFLEADPAEVATPTWQRNYASAVAAATASKQKLAIFFHPAGDTSTWDHFRRGMESHPGISQRLTGFTTAALPVDYYYFDGQRKQKLLSHPVFAPLGGRPGLAILDLSGGPLHGKVVSLMPGDPNGRLTTRQLLTLFSLPDGTLTQRTLVYAVRMHAERPASTTGAFDPVLAAEAHSHSSHQARIRRQGHHNWDSRFHRINARMPGGLMAQEVCAESWPGQGLLEAATECVHSWRQSPGHWGAVRRAQSRYAYDMQRGANGVWYATGIFANRGG